MHLLIMRTSEDIPYDDIVKTANGINKMFSVKSNPVRQIPEGISTKSSLEEVGKIMYEKILLEKETPFIALFFTTENIQDERILGIADRNNRVAFVKYSGEYQSDVNTAIHELGHCFGKANHCNACIMKPYHDDSFDVMNYSLSQLFCESCRITIENGKFLERIRNASSAKTQRNKLEKTVAISESPAINIKSSDTFPELSVYDKNPYEFFDKALRHYNFGGTAK